MEYMVILIGGPAARSGHMSVLDFGLCPKALKRPEDEKKKTRLTCLSTVLKFTSIAL